MLLKVSRPTTARAPRPVPSTEDHAARAAVPPKPKARAPARRRPKGKAVAAHRVNQAEFRAIRAQMDALIGVGPVEGPLEGKGAPQEALVVLQAPWQQEGQTLAVQSDLLAAAARPDPLDPSELVPITPESDRAMGQRLRRRMLRTSCVYFARHMLSEEFLVGDLHVEWDELIHRHKRLCILAPRDHGKSWWWALAYPLWRAFNHQSGRRGSFVIFSASENQARVILDIIRTELETNPKLSHLTPAKKTRGWSGKDLRLANGYWIRARGFGTKVRGGHPQDVLVDDGLNDETIYSPTTRQKQIDYFYSAITNMVTPGGRIIVSGTPFHQQDLYGDLAGNPEYTARSYPAIREDGRALFPERYSLEQLAGKRREIGPIRFAREFLCQALHDDMSLFPRRLFQGDPVEQPSVRLGLPLDYWLRAGIEGVYMAVDFALSANVGADWTVMVVIGLDVMGNRWLMEVRRHQGMPYQEQLSLINELGRLYQPGVIMCEGNQAQRIFGDELIRMTDLPIRLHMTGVEKHSLEKGVPGIRVLLENHKYRLPRGDQRSVELTNEFVNEFVSFTWHEGKLVSVGGHDDMVMADWLCELGISLGAFSFSMGDGVDGRPPAPAAPAGPVDEQEARLRQAMAASLAGGLPRAVKPVGDGEDLLPAIPGFPRAPAAPGPTPPVPVAAPAPSSPAPVHPLVVAPSPPPPAGHGAWDVQQAFHRAGMPDLSRGAGQEVGPLGFPKGPGES